MNVTVIIPCLNEEKTIRTCIEKAQRALHEGGHEGEVLVVDNNSTDRSKDIAQECGARVVTVMQRGYGVAVRTGLHAASGNTVVIGDGDDSYDFSELSHFVNTLETRGLDLLIGNRFKGKIEKGAMPFLNQYFGNPVLSGVGRMLYGNVCGDFHCGLRAAKRDSLISLELKAPGMEFASEMIIKAATRKLRIGETPTTLYPDGRDRPPHLRRWRDGLRHLRLLFMYKLSGKP